MEEKREITLSIAEGMELGKVFAESGVFPDIKTAAQGYVKILAGKEIGLSPMQSINSFYFVNGRLGIVAQGMSALIKKSGKYDYEIDKHTTEECQINFYRIDGEKKDKIGESRFDIKMAAKAGIVNKDNWKNYPANMLFARALANGARWFTPDAISGFYTVEELQDIEPSKKLTEITFNGKDIEETPVEETLTEEGETNE